MENKAAAVPIELPAPPGWKKRGASCSSTDPETSGVLIDAYLGEFTPRKSSTPRRNDIVFVSPDGDEIKNRSQLDKYLKSHPGGPSASEFDWGTGDTPRRSTRLGEKSKATETPESDNPRKKRQRKSSSEKGAKEDGDEREAEGAIEKETKASDEPALPDAEDLEVQDVEIASKNLTDGDNIKDEEEKTNDCEIFPKEPPASEDKMEIVQEKEETKDEEEKTYDGDFVPEEPPANEDEMELVQEKEETLDEGNIEKMKNREAEDKPLDNSLKADNKTLPLNVFEENKIESKPAGTDASSISAELSKATCQEEIAEEAPAAADALNVLEENKIESKPAGADTSSHSAELSKATSVSQEEAPAAADPPVQDSSDGKVHENEQIDREIPIEEINGTEVASAGVNNSVQQEATVVDQATSS